MQCMSLTWINVEILYADTAEMRHPSNDNSLSTLSQDVNFSGKLIVILLNHWTNPSESRPSGSRSFD